MKPSIKAVLFLTAVLPFFGSAAEKVIFKETFDSPESLKKWHKVEYPNGSTLTVDNGALSVNHKHLPGQGSYIEIPLPLIPRGKIEFDVKIDPERIRPVAQIGLYLEIYNISTFWHDSCMDWRMYFSEPNAKRLPHFNIEPVGHQRIAIVNKHVYSHYTISFDEKNDLVEFYVGNGKDPLSARYDVSVFGHSFFRGGSLRIGSYSYTDDPYRTLVDNVVVTEITEDAGETVKDTFLLFDGAGSDHFKVNKLLKNSKKGRYIWNGTGANIETAKNNFVYVGMPSVRSLEEAKLIIFNDAPNVHTELQKRIMKCVKEGSDLLILSGLFSLTKGNFKDSVLEKILPAKLGGHWSFAGDRNKALSLQTKAPFNWNAAGKFMYFYHQVEPVEGSRILMTAGNGNVPVLMSRKFGKGTVYLLAAAPCGPNRKESFYNSDFTEKLLQFIESERIAK